MTTKFDPNAAATEDSGIFGLPFPESDSALVYVPVPWEATTSYGGGTSHGPSAILQASKQVDLFDTDVNKPYEAGLFMRSESEDVKNWNEVAKTHAQMVIEAGGDVGGDPELENALQAVNEWSAKLNHYVYQQTSELLQAGKIVSIVGGDHSVPFGAIQAVAEKHPSFGVLHFDAHSDTRIAYEGFTWSHASIMYNVLERIPQVTQLVQVGIRDLCEQEMDYIQKQGNRVSLFLDRTLARRKFEGANWSKLAQEIIAPLPSHVWISFDIDGLDPRFCPHTGTPVPGGLDFQEANYLIAILVQSGRKVIGFDLNEVAPNLENMNDEWDANVGARLLYKLTGWTLVSQGLARAF